MWLSAYFPFLHFPFRPKVLENWSLSPGHEISSACPLPRGWGSDIPCAAQTHGGHTTAGSSAAGQEMRKWDGHDTELQQFIQTCNIKQCMFYLCF